MTRQQFHTQLLKLLRRAHRGGLCPACAVGELIAAAEAVSLLAELSSTELADHGIPMLQPLEESRDHLH